MQSINLATQDALKNQGIPAHFQQEVGSTNTWSRQEFPKSSETQAVYLVDRQPQGRGRNQRTWSHAADGSALLSTWCYRCPSPPQPILSPLIGLAVYQSLVSNWPQLSFRLKAPNDIFLDDKKLLGLLIEAESDPTPGSHCIFVGLGMNVLAAPTVDQPTIALNERTDVSMESWSSFCKNLQTSLAANLEKGLLKDISKEDRKLLRNAMLGSQNHNTASRQNLQEVLADGSIVLKDQTIHWRDL